jgi:hypothetical protein
MQRVNRSCAIVSCAPTQRQVTSSNANTSRSCVSSTTYFPGRVARSRPNVPLGRSAIERRPFALPDTALVPLVSSASRRYAVAVDGRGTTPSPMASSRWEFTRASTAERVAVAALMLSASTARTASSHRASTREPRP